MRGTPPLIPANAGTQRKKLAEGHRCVRRVRPDLRLPSRVLRSGILRRIPAGAGTGGGRGLIALAGLLALLAATPTRAVEPDEMLRDPALEARARTISAGLRCLVCQNQSIDDSAAPLARDLRLIVREHLKAGDSDDEIRRYLVARYGDFVLLKPPFEPATWLLWGTPFLVVVAGGAGLLLRRRTGAGVPAVLSDDERARVETLLQDTRGESA